MQYTTSNAAHLSIAYRSYGYGYGPAGQGLWYPWYLWYASSSHACLIFMLVNCTVKRMHESSIAYEHRKCWPFHMAWSLIVCITCSTRWR